MECSTHVSRASVCGATVCVLTVQESVHGGLGPLTSSNKLP